MAGNTVKIKAVLDDKVSGGLAKMTDKFDRLGKNKGASAILQGVGLGAGSAAFNLLGSAAGAASDFIVGSIDAARDMSETLSKSRTVFGSAAGTIEAFGDTTAASLGIAKQSAIDAAAGFGFMFTGLGETEAAAAEMSKKLVVAAGDIASFNNIDTSTALEKLRSGLAGESEPLRQVGIFLTEGKVKAKALALGLADAHGELSEGAKVTARYSLILEEMGVQAGDAGRTIGELAGQQRVATAEMADAQARLGKSFEPVALQGSKAAVAFLENIDVINMGLEVLTLRSGAAAQAVVVNMGSVDEAMTGTANNAGKATDDVVTSIRKVAREVKVNTEDAATSFETMTKAMSTAAQDAIDTAFDPLIARDRLMAANAEIAAAKRVLASKTATNAEKRDAQDTLDSVGKSQAEYLVELAEAGKTGFAAYKTGIANLKTAIAAASGPAKAALQSVLDKILLIEKHGNIGIHVNVSGNVGFGGAKAGGGPVKANTAYLVGENGPELFVPNSGGGIVPNGGTGTSTSGGGGGTTLVINTLWPPTREQVRMIAGVLDEANHTSLQRRPPTAMRT